MKSLFILIEPLVTLSINEMKIGFWQWTNVIAIQCGGGGIDAARHQTAFLMISRIDGNAGIFPRNLMAGLVRVLRQGLLLPFFSFFFFLRRKQPFDILLDTFLTDVLSGRCASAWPQSLLGMEQIASFVCYLAIQSLDLLRICPIVDFIC